MKLPGCVLVSIGAYCGAVWWLWKYGPPISSNNDDNLSLAQNVFILFYAIFWGFVSEVQPRWKAFNWPVASVLNRTRKRAWSAVLAFVIAPAALFVPLFWLFGACQRNYVVSVVTPLVAAHIPFGIYRFWMSLMESTRETYYYSKFELECLTAKALKNKLEQRKRELDQEHVRLTERIGELKKEKDALSALPSTDDPLCATVDKDGLRLKAPIIGVEPSSEELHLYDAWGGGNFRVGIVYFIVGVGAALAYLLM